MKRRAFKCWCLSGSLIFASCSFEVTPEPSLTNVQEEVITYFKEVALGFEFGNDPKVTRKWMNNIRVFVGGNPDPVLLQELELVVQDLNMLISQSQIEIQIVSDSSKSNFYYFMGSEEQMRRIAPEWDHLLDNNWGLVQIMHNSDQITEGLAYVNTNKPTLVKRRHLLREEFTQGLGLGNDSQKYTDSIFQSSYRDGCTTQFSEIDKALVQLLYDPRIVVGLNEASVNDILRRIIPEYI